MRKFKDKKGSGCKLCKPHKHGWADNRTIQEKRKDTDTEQQIRSVAQAVVRPPHKG